MVPKKKLVVTSASLLVTSALLVVTRSYYFNLLFSLILIANIVTSQIICASTSSRKLRLWAGGASLKKRELSCVHTNSLSC